MESGDSNVLKAKQAMESFTRKLSPNQFQALQRRMMVHIESGRASDVKKAMAESLHDFRLNYNLIGDRTSRNAIDRNVSTFLSSEYGDLSDTLTSFFNSNALTPEEKGQVMIRLVHESSGRFCQVLDAFNKDESKSPELINGMANIMTAIANDPKALFECQHMMNTSTDIVHKMPRIPYVSSSSKPMLFKRFEKRDIICNALKSLGQDPPGGDAVSAFIQHMTRPSDVARLMKALGNDTFNTMIQHQTLSEAAIKNMSFSVCEVRDYAVGFQFDSWIKPSDMAQAQEIMSDVVAMLVDACQPGSDLMAPSAGSNTSTPSKLAMDRLHAALTVEPQDRTITMTDFSLTYDLNYENKVLENMNRQAFNALHNQGTLGTFLDRITKNPAFSRANALDKTTALVLRELPNQSWETRLELLKEWRTSGGVSLDLQAMALLRSDSSSKRRLDIQLVSQFVESATTTDDKTHVMAVMAQLIKAGHFESDQALAELYHHMKTSGQLDALLDFVKATATEEKPVSDDALTVIPKLIGSVATSSKQEAKAAYDHVSDTFSDLKKYQQLKQLIDWQFRHVNDGAQFENELPISPSFTHQFSSQLHRYMTDDRRTPSTLPMSLDAKLSVVYDRLKKAHHSPHEYRNKRLRHLLDDAGISTKGEQDAVGRQLAFVDAGATGATPTRFIDAFGSMLETSVKDMVGSNDRARLNEKITEARKFLGSIRTRADYDSMTRQLMRQMRFQGGAGELYDVDDFPLNDLLAASQGGRVPA